MRAAASSMASGSPSRRTQISATAGALSVVMAKAGLTATALWMNSSMAAYREKEDLITIGAYQRGADPKIDYAIEKLPAIDGFLRQHVDEPTTADDAEAALGELVADRLPAALA